MKISGYKVTIRWYEANAQKYALITQNTLNNDRIQLEEFTTLLPSHAKVLDAGCGAGRDTELLRKKGCTVTGIDISHNLLEEAKKLYPKCIFMYGDMLQLPFADECFDGVWAHASIVHFDKDKQIIKAVSEIYRVLKPNGIAHILVRAKKDKAKQVIKDSLTGHNRFYKNISQDELKNLLEKNSLNIISLLHYDESKRDPQKRPGENVEWIVALTKK
jgi:ubiquinone/menaquinone biosynthesis C-methylase UbiE